MQELLDFVSYSIQTQERMENIPEHKTLCIKMNTTKGMRYIGRKKSDDFFSTLLIPDNVVHVLLEPKHDDVVSSSFLVQFIDNISKNHTNIEYVGITNPNGSHFHSELRRAMQRFSVRKSVD